MRSGTSPARSFTPVTFNTQWRDSGTAGPGHYSFDTAGNALYVFFDEKDTQAEVTINYSVTRAMKKKQDCAELYWKFIGETWEVDSHNVSLRVHLPIPEGEALHPGRNVHAWGHGELSGTVSLDKEKGVVKADVPAVSAKTWAEIRILTPPLWLSNVFPGDANFYEITDCDSIMKQEEKFATRANLLRLRYWILGGIYLFLILVLAGVYLRFGREYKPTFTDKYWRDLPAANLDASFGLPRDLHPIIVHANENFGIIRPDSFSTAVVHLAYGSYVR